jgi:cytochrome c oxidase subunit 2
VLPLQQIIPRGTRVEVFDTIYQAFLALGTLVGIVVISYMIYNAYKYRDGASRGPDDDADRPQLGELPQGGGKGRKLFLSFALSAIVVSSLIVWTYGTLLYVEGKPTDDIEQSGQPDALDHETPLVIRVEGFQFGWEYHYPNNHTQFTLKIPEDRTVQIVATSSDVWHNFGIPEYRIKTDAIPGQRTTTWFIAEETGTVQAICYELCGQGHSGMRTDVEVVTQEEFTEWYSGLNGSDTTDWPLADQGQPSEPEGEGEGDGEARLGPAPTGATPGGVAP